MWKSNNRIPRRRFLKGISVTGILGAIALRFGLPIGPVMATSEENSGFIVLGKDEPLPSSVRRPTVGMSFEGGAGSGVTSWNEVFDVTAFARRARIPMYDLAPRPRGYSGPVYRVAESLSGPVPRASVTYELLSAQTGLPESIIAVVGMPKVATPEPFPLRGNAVPASYLPGPGYELRERDSDLHFWQEGGVTYLLMHIVYDGAPDAVPLGGGHDLAARLVRI